MAKFHFPMEQVYQVKKKLEKQKQLELGKAMQELSESRQHLEDVNRKLYEANTSFQMHIAVGKINQYDLKKAHERIHYFHEAITEQKRRVQEKEEKVEEAKNALKTALQERKVFETLKEKAYETYLEEERNEETKRLDEIVSYKYRNS